MFILLYNIGPYLCLYMYLKFNYSRPVKMDASFKDFILPTLLQKLRTILEQYPDDGQILKVVNLPLQSINNIALNY